MQKMYRVIEPTQWWNLNKNNDENKLKKKFGSQRDSKKIIKMDIKKIQLQCFYICIRAYMALTCTIQCSSKNFFEIISLSFNILLLNRNIVEITFLKYRVTKKEWAKIITCLYFESILLGGISSHLMQQLNKFE